MLEKLRPIADERGYSLRSTVQFLYLGHVELLVVPRSPGW